MFVCIQLYSLIVQCGAEPHNPDMKSLIYFFLVTANILLNACAVHKIYLIMGLVLELTNHRSLIV